MNRMRPQKLHVDMQQDVITCPMSAGSVLLMNAHSMLLPLFLHPTECMLDMVCSVCPSGPPSQPSPLRVSMRLTRHVHVISNRVMTLCHNKWCLTLKGSLPAFMLSASSSSRLWGHRCHACAHLSTNIAVFIAYCCYAVPHRSLSNLSSGVRWSIDLRWQRPDLPNGFYGLKKCIVLTKKGDPSFTPDWKSWAAVDSGQLQQKKMGKKSKDAMSQYYGDNIVEDFDATVHGPTMEIVNHNKHTAAHDMKPDIKSKA